jgi:hypothetical protein
MLLWSGTKLNPLNPAQSNLANTSPPFFPFLSSFLLYVSRCFSPMSCHTQHARKLPGGGIRLYTKDEWHSDCNKTTLMRIKALILRVAYFF